MGPLPSGGGRGGEGAGAEGEGKGPLAGAPPLGVSSGCPGDGRPAPVPRLASPCRPRLFTCPRAAPPGPARRRRAAAREGAGAANSNGGGRRAAVTSAPRARGARRESAAGRGRGGGGRRAERSGGFCACAGGRRTEGAEGPGGPSLLPGPGSFPHPALARPSTAFFARRFDRAGSAVARGSEGGRCPLTPARRRRGCGPWACGWHPLAEGRDQPDCGPHLRTLGVFLLG